ncbi:MAG: HlyD family efflux transporter periplasmic adaptor subunit [Ferruginibacter sp.]|nr:HlyD family efflux transporter periplasmic adaptor subunit [Ferruginibacter sp.]
MKSYSLIYKIRHQSRVKYWLIGIFLGLLVILFIPWTQNIRANGTVTTLRQEDRPQQLNTIIPGKISKWWVKEGDFVKAGDTILQLSEIKDDYLDPQLLLRTNEQIVSKELSMENYKSKANAADLQIGALMQGQSLKTSQIENKISQQRMKLRSDSMEFIAAKNDFNIANKQYQRQKEMFENGLVSLTQLEQRNATFQNASAKMTSAEIKYSNSRQELNLLQLELNGAIQDYNEKISKASGDKFQSLSQIASTQADVSKLRNQYMNYDIRSKLYFIKAPQDGQIVKAKKAGIGEIVKDGEMLVEIVPTRVQYAIEIFVRPVDLPLISIGQKVRFMFDGFPAIVFSGWPAASYGTFGGKIAAIENAVTPNGKFRVLVAEDKSDKPWPKELRIGGGAQAMALLKTVPVWYELWRNINGFPPDFYTVETQKKPSEKNDKK